MYLFYKPAAARGHVISYLLKCFTIYINSKSGNFTESNRSLPLSKCCLVLGKQNAPPTDKDLHVDGNWPCYGECLFVIIKYAH